jgi:hypothetical protein
MSILFLLNTVPMYFIRFRNKTCAHRFGTELKLYGDAHETQYRYKVLDDSNKITEKNLYNSFRIEEMPRDLYNEIVREMRSFNMKRYYREIS